MTTPKVPPAAAAVENITTVATSAHFQPGGTWTCVRASGEHTEYVYDHQIIGAAGDFDSMHALLNPATGKHAQVTRKWLLEGPGGASSAYWLPGKPAGQLEGIEPDEEVK